MKFYNRESELESLNNIYEQCNQNGKLTVLTGRRRVGKTMLAKKYAENKQNLYLFISKKSEKLLCQEFLELYEIFSKEQHIGKIDRFIDIFELLLKHGINNRFVLIIDEFQEFYNVNQSIYSEIQKIWDQYKFQTNCHIIFIGSVYSLMVKIFQDSKEPLFGRADKIFYLKPFKIKTIAEILSDNKKYSNLNLFYSYLFTGGIPRYLEIMAAEKSFSLEKIISSILKKDSMFINEGKTLLIQEFGKDYGTYFSILELISEGKTSRSEMESIFEKSIGGYLERLENEYDLIKKIKPIGAKKDSRIQKYTIKDNFLKIWFRFVYKNITIIEEERFEYVSKIVKRDISTYSGPILEKLFQELLGEREEIGLIGNYWERGNLNEIDIVAVNDLDKKLILCDVKINKEKLKINKLEEKSEKLRQKYKGYEIEYRGYSIENIDEMI
jgi:uncharacterized protein